MWHSKGARRQQQQGMTLVEVLVSLVIFSIGVLGLMGLHASALSSTTKAKYRTDASFLANQLIGQLWTNRQILESSPTQFAHRADSGADLCAPTGAEATHPLVTGWLAEVQATLPGAHAARQQLRIEANQKVVVTICWQMPSDKRMHNHIEVAQLVGSPIN